MSSVNYVTKEALENMKAELQRIIEDVYNRKKFTKPSEWFKNDKLLNKIYDVVNNLNDNTRAKFLRVSKNPFNLEFQDSSYSPVKI